ncbi:MAG: hypothetical protein FWD88_04320 [Treponema sp.]|nr:hypothetical protein [Treponema sp.]
MMRKKLFVMSAAVLLASMSVFFTACDQSLLRPDDDDGKDSGLVVGIMRLYLDSPLVAATAAVGEMRLRLDRFPPHNTMDIEDVVWEVSGQSGIVGVERYIDDDTGNEYGIVTITQEAKEYLAGTPLPLETTIRARYRHDHSIYAMATVMALPNWPTSRNRVFNLDGGVTVASGDVETRLGNLGFHRNDDGDWHLGDGVFLLLGTGNVAPDPQRAGGIDHIQGVFEIDPDDPYGFGVTPLGTPRPLHTMEGGHIRTAGDGMRALRLMGLERPFEIELVYASNGADSRWAYVRFGDTSGVMVEGPVSPGTGIQRTVRIRWDYHAYYTNHYHISPWGEEFNYWYQQRHFVLDEYGERIPRDDFVPFVFVELVRGIQLSRVTVRTPGDALWTPEWVCPQIPTD